MPKVDLKIYSTDAAEGKKITTSVTYVNPDASNSVLQSFAQQLNAFTTNTYGETDRVETVNVDTEGSRKQFRNLAVTGARADSTATITCKQTAEEEFSPAAFFYTNGSVQFLTATRSSSTDPTQGKFNVTIPNSIGWLYIGITEKTDFHADFIAAEIQ